MSTPPEIKKLSVIARSTAGPGNVDEVMQYLPLFRAAHAVVDRETNSEGKRGLIAYIQNLVPAEGPGRVFILSFLASLTQDSRHLEDLYQTLFKGSFNPEQRFFFYWQILTRHSRAAGSRVLDPIKMYFELLDSCRALLGIRLHWIDPKDRMADTVVVFTNQLLGIQHAPTADCLDYCHILQSRLKKRVILINTADMPWSTQLPYYDPVLFNYDKGYSSGVRFKFRGEAFDFYQCRQPMPNLAELGLIVRKVLEIKPAFILSLGHSNIAADLCAELLTVATMPFGTNLSRSGGNLFILPRALRSEDHEFMNMLNISRGQVVETLYTFRLPDRSSVLTRQQLGVPEDAYVIAVVGNRLDEEMNDSFSAELSDFLLSTPRAFVAFMGTFQGYGALAQKMPVIGNRSVFLGHQKDILAVYECCDAYLNPPRWGGGSSAAFALGLGLPVFTRASGDVANIVGDQFFFPSLGEVHVFVEKSLLDPEHRHKWATKAKARFTEISNREGMLAHIVQQVTEKSDVRGRAYPKAAHSTGT